VLERIRRAWPLRHRTYGGMNWRPASCTTGQQAAPP